MLKITIKKNLSKMTVAELKEIATDTAISFETTIKKDELIELILKSVPKKDLEEMFIGTPKEPGWFKRTGKLFLKKWLLPIGGVVVGFGIGTVLGSRGDVVVGNTDTSESTNEGDTSL